MTTIFKKQMPLEDEDEILPLIDCNRRDQGNSDVEYQSVLRSSIKALHMKKNSIGGKNLLKNLKTQKSDSRSLEQRVTYSWNNLNVYRMSRTGTSLWRKILSKDSKASEKPKEILRNVNGIAHAGELLAIMGASGAGKTTLLNALTFHSGDNIIVKGDRRLNGIPVVDRNTTAGLSAYVEQENLFIGTLTVKEHLIFQSLLRIDRNTSYQKKLKRVEDVIIELGLEKCQNTIIGYEGRTKGISGGERKRLSFASEILTNPPIMFCDEPTSGLDSFMALNVINVLKSMAISGKTVICTIHQPSSEIFSLFDKILLIAEGRAAFLGRPDEAFAFFSELGASPPANYNPADFYINLLAVVPNQEEISKRNVKLICDYFDNSPQGLELTGGIDCEPQSQDLNETQPALKSCCVTLVKTPNKFTHTATWLSQFRALFWRSWINIIKEPILVKVRLFQTVVGNTQERTAIEILLPMMISFYYGLALPCLLTFLLPIILSLVVGLIYHGQKLDEEGVMNINGVLFTFLTNMTFQNLFAVISVFCTELPIFLKEQSNKLYRVDAYFLAKSLAEIPMFLAIPFIFTSITYYWINLNSELYHFGFTVLILILVTNVATSFGYFISCVSTNVVMALSIGPPIIIPFLLFGGFLLHMGAVPGYFKWLSYFSWFKYGNEALLINQWADIKNIECNTSAVTCPRTGEIVLEIYNFNKDNFWWNLSSLFLLILLFRSLAFAALVLKAKRYQRS